MCWTIWGKIWAAIERVTRLSGADFGVLPRLEDLDNGQLAQQAFASSMPSPKFKFLKSGKQVFTIPQLQQREVPIAFEPNAKNSCIHLSRVGILTKLREVMRFGVRKATWASFLLHSSDPAARLGRERCRLSEGWPRLFMGSLKIPPSDRLVERAARFRRR